MPNVPDPTPTCPECGERMLDNYEGLPECISCKFAMPDPTPAASGPCMAPPKPDCPVCRGTGYEPDPVHNPFETIPRHSDTLPQPCACRLTAAPTASGPAFPVYAPAEKCRDKAASLIDPLRQTARALGYSLAVHGSLARDIDLIACPWTDEAADAETLAEAIRAKAAELVGIAFLPTRTAREFPRRKPHGRLCWLFHLGDGSTYIDLSVMPRDPLAVAVAETYPTPLAWSVDWDRVENVETFMTEGSAYRIGERGGHWFFEVLGSGNGFMPTRDEAVNMARLFCKAAETKGATT